MRILPFRQSNTRPAMPAGRDWSQQELADFYRAHRLLAQNGVSIGMDRGQTDDGDPWMVFFDTATQDVFLHVARLDGRCILICDTLEIRLSRNSIAETITAFEGEVRQALTIRQDRSSNVLLHPAARIIMSISAVFLLFKLENGGAAQAKGMMADPALQDAARKQDLSFTARIHQAIGRLLDMADTPAAAAAIAGAILTIELTRSHAPDEAHHDALMAEATHGAPGIVVAELQLDPVSTEHTDATDQLQTVSSPALPIAVETTSVDLREKVEITVSTKTVAVAQSAEQPSPSDEANANDNLPAIPAEAHRTAPSTAGSGVATAASTTQTATAASDTVELASLAALAIKPLLSHDSSAAVTTPAGGSSLVEPLPADVTAAVTSVPVSIGDISVANLDALDATVGLFRETALVGEQLTDTIITFMARFGSYEVEIADGKVLIEQHDASALSNDLVGIWTNVMADGSEISVIGHLALVSDVTLGLA